METQMIVRIGNKHLATVLLATLVLSMPTAYAAKTDKMEAAYKSAHGDDAYYTCLQWQKDNGQYLNQQTRGGIVLPVFTPKCGIKAEVSSPPHKMLTDWMPEPGEGTSNAKKIINNAIAQGAKFDSDKTFDECTNWRYFVVDLLIKINNYPAYPNTIKYYQTPHCGVGLSNNDTNEQVYLWMPNNLISAVPVDDPAQICSRIKNSKGQYVLATTPCHVTNPSQADYGIAETSINSDPRGAELIMNGVVVAHAPAILILDSLGNRSNVYTMNVKLEGYEEGSINVKSGDVIMVPLTPKSVGH
jgi:hypothetical protein